MVFGHCISPFDCTLTMSLTLNVFFKAKKRDLAAWLQQVKPLIPSNYSKPKEKGHVQQQEPVSVDTLNALIKDGDALGVWCNEFRVLRKQARQVWEWLKNSNLALSEKSKWWGQPCSAGFDGNDEQIHDLQQRLAQNQQCIQDLPAKELNARNSARAQHRYVFWFNKLFNNNYPFDKLIILHFRLKYQALCSTVPDLAVDVGDVEARLQAELWNMSAEGNLWD